MEKKTKRARVKPVLPTEIKSKKMVREVIQQIQKPIPPEVYARQWIIP
jgi:hypothetical protein